MRVGPTVCVYVYVCAGRMKQGSGPWGYVPAAGGELMHWPFAAACAAAAIPVVSDRDFLSCSMLQTNAGNIMPLSSTHLHTCSSASQIDGVVVSHAF